MHYLQECYSSKEELENIKNKLLTDRSFMPDLSNSEKFNLLTQIEESLSNINDNISDFLFETSDIEHYQFLQEVNIRRLDQKTQRNLKKIFIAIQLAKQANDPLYTKYAKGVMLRKTNKELILKKYGNKAYQMALAQEHGPISQSSQQTQQSK